MIESVKPDQNPEHLKISHQFIHDISSDLFCIGISAKNLELYMDNMLALYEEARKAGLEVPEIPGSHLELLKNAGPDIISQLESIKTKSKQFIDTLNPNTDADGMNLNQVQNTSALNEFSNTSQRILLVEDEEIQQDITCHVLAPINCIIECADNGLQAIEMIRKQSYDLILMDLHMPHMGGMEAVQLIRSMGEANKHTPIIGISNIEPADPGAFFNAGFNKFLLKPLRLDMFNQALSQLYPHRKM